MEQNIFLQMDYKIISYLYQLVNTWLILVKLIKFIRGHLKEHQKKVLKTHLHNTIALLKGGLMIIKQQKQNLMATV